MSRTSCWVIGAAGFCALAISGCAASIASPKQLYEPDMYEATSGSSQLGGTRFGMQGASACASCADRQQLQDYAHHAAPYVAGPFAHRRAAAGYASEQASLQPPHSKFHPVPTRPVFETRASYSPPQPIGVQLVPIPEPGLHSMTPYLPPDAMSPALDGSDFEGADTFILAPPSN